MEHSADKIHKPKQWPAGKTKVGGIRIRIEWETINAISYPNTDRRPKTYMSLRGSQGRRTGVARSLNPYCGKLKAVNIPEKIIGKAFLDPKGDFLLKGLPIVDPKTRWSLSCDYKAIFTWVGPEIPEIIKPL